MTKTVTQIANPKHDAAYAAAEQQWEKCKPPYTSSHMRVCVTAAKIILNKLGLSRRSKYEKESYLRIDFSKAGKVTIYAEFPKKMNVKGQRLGEWPELTLPIAREKAAELAAGGLKADSVIQVIESYEADLAAKVKRHKLGEGSYQTYLCRSKNVKLAFSEHEAFSSITYNRLVKVIDDWIATKTNNHALELFAELRRIWKYGSPLYCSGRNVAASLPDDYVSSRVQRPTPTKLFTDIESIARLWINMASAPSIHQKNAMRYMILTGVRPINVSNLEWRFIDDDLTVITYPAGVIGTRGAMKTQKEFAIPVTPEIKNILLEQRQWRDAVSNCNQQFVFLQPRNPMEAFSKRSLDKLIKDYSPENAVKGVRHDGTVKGRSGAFNTMCRKFLKSNVIAQMRAQGFSRSDTKEISMLCMHHSDKESDPMAEHYDFSDEILKEEMKLKRQAFTAHEDSIMVQVALLKRKT
ncbi:recombinase [Pantoea agglomerans]|uniref:recombinase n=1 Tax=Enterobacter agglomerans TaxID=549 RepID=UPI0013B8B703|nr:recombinase [Pantoea agglomerans]NEG58230.1 recombinase [Pantoea agglomerans]NEG99943.1 recombinase [Pantoea agglomerans]NEH04094.1 recombinase [Pantoea agglomerans]NEH14503.1 recombinase [Pantoea agglomerans]